MKEIIILYRSHILKMAQLKKHDFRVNIINYVNITLSIIKIKETSKKIIKILQIKKDDFFLNHQNRSSKRTVFKD